MKNKKEERYILNVSEKQLQVIMESLDFYSRIKMGQLGEIARRIGSGYTDRFEETAREMKKVLFPELIENSYHGIYSDKVGKETHIAWDIYQQIRHDYSYHKNPEGGTGVCFDEPMFCSGEKTKKLEVINE